MGAFPVTVGHNLAHLAILGNANEGPWFIPIKMCLMIGIRRRDLTTTIPRPLVLFTGDFT